MSKTLSECACSKNTVCAKATGVVVVVVVVVFAVVVVVVVDILFKSQKSNGKFCLII